jgi:hypothetical protein
MATENDLTHCPDFAIILLQWQLQQKKILI